VRSNSVADKVAGSMRIAAGVSILPIPGVRHSRPLPD
jgi:hypothetical protein